MAKKAMRGAKTRAAKKSSARKSATRKAARKPAQPGYKPAGTTDVVMMLVLKNAAGAIEFYTKVFGAKEQRRMMAPGGGGIWHAELRIGDSTLYLNDEMPGGSTVAPGPDRKPTAAIQLYVRDVDAVFSRALEAGAKPSMPLMDMFWGDRMGMVLDPFGQQWALSTRVKNLSDEEARKAGEEFAAKMARMHQQGGGGPPSSAAQ